MLHDLARCRRAQKWPGVACMAFLVVSTQLGSSDAAGRQREVLKQSLFGQDAEGWLLTQGMAEERREPAHGRGVISGSDPWGMANVWWFSAPQAFVEALRSEKARTYGVELCFSFSQPESPRLPAKQLQDAPDVLLESHCGSKIGIFGLITPGAKVVRERCVQLEQGRGWMVGRTSATGRTQWIESASLERLGGVLWHLTGIHMRGSHFEGQETSQLSRVRMFMAPQSTQSRTSRMPAVSAIMGCCQGGRLALQCKPTANSTSLNAFTAHGEFDQHGAQRMGSASSSRHNRSTFGADVCRLAMHSEPMGACRAGTETGRDADGLLWPVDGSLPCDGDLSAVPLISDVSPRFGRRRGGSLITVTGENFGLTGTRPILRVSGSTGGCWHLPTDTPAGNPPPPDESLPAHCRDGVLNDGEDKVDCGGADCPRCERMQLPAHCRDGVQSSDETGVDMGGRDCLPAHCLSGEQGDETGANCGGSCQPCNPAPVTRGNQHSRMVCEVPPGPVGSRWGVQVATRDASGAAQAACPGPAIGAPWGQGNHWRAAGFEFGRLETKWASALIPDGVVTDAEIVSLQVDQTTGDTYIVGTVLGRVVEDTRQAASRQTVPGRTNPFADGNAPEGLGIGVGPDDTAKRGGFVGRLSREGRLQWLTAIQPGELVGGTTSAEALPSSLSIFHTLTFNDSLCTGMQDDGGLRVMVAGIYQDAEINFFHAHPTTRSAAGQGEASGPPVKCELGIGYGSVKSVEQGDEFADGQRKLVCTHVQLPNPPVPSYNAFVAMYNADGLVMWVKGDLAASSNIQATLEGAPTVQLVAGVSRSSITGGTSYFAVLTGTLQILTDNAQGVFRFGTHPGLWVDGGYPLSDQSQTAVTVSFGGAGYGQPRVGFVAQFHMTDVGSWVEWVRMVGSIGTPFQADVGVKAVAARGRRAGAQQQPAEEEVIVVTGSFNAGSLSTLGSLPIQDCTYDAALDGGLTQRGSLCTTTYNPLTTAEPQVPYNGTVDGRNGFVVAYNSQGKVLWARSIGGTTQVTAAAVFNGYKKAAAARSYSGATPREYVASRRRVSIGPLEEGSFVAVVGNLGKLSEFSSRATASTFGVTRQPTWCSAGHTVGDKTAAIQDSQPCSGVLQSRGEHSDVFVAKYDLHTGEPEWAKRIGLQDAHEEAFGVSVGIDGSIFIAGAFTAPFVVTSGTVHDVFDLVAAGRPFSVGCGLFNRNTAAITVQLAKGLGYYVDPTLASDETIPLPSSLNQPALPSCLILPHAPLLQTAFVAKVVDGLQPLFPSQVAVDHGRTNATDIPAFAWGPAEHGSCGNAAGEECLADGVVWGRSVGVGQGVFSSQSVAAMAVAAVDGDAEGEWGVDVDSATGGVRGTELDSNGVVVGGMFSGFRETQSVTLNLDDSAAGAADGTGGFYLQDRRDVGGFVVHWRE